MLMLRTESVAPPFTSPPHVVICRHVVYFLMQASILLPAPERATMLAHSHSLGGHVEVVALIDAYQKASNERTTATMTQTSTGHTAVTEVPSEHGVRIKLKSAWRRYIE